MITLTPEQQTVIDAAIAYREIAATDVIHPGERLTLQEMLAKGKAINDKQQALFAAVDRLTATEEGTT